MVQQTDVTSQARSIIGRFPDLAGKRALVTGIVDSLTRLQLPMNVLQP